MWLRQLKLSNFQKHSDLTLDFTQGVNIIHGHSDAGKSCIRRAIGFLFFGDPRTDSVIRKEGTKVTSVIALLDNGTEVERVKSSSINRYIIRIPNQKELVYDSIGATIPEEVQNVLQMKLVEIDQDSLNLNISEQVSMPFLTDMPGSTRLKLFNKLCGNDLLDVVVANFNKEILHINKELKNVKQILEINNPKVESLTKEITSRKSLLSSLEEKRIKIEKDVSKYNKLKELQLNFQSNKQALSAVIGELNSIKTCDEAAIASLKSQVQMLTALTSLKTAFILCKKELEGVSTQISLVKAPELNGEALRGLLKRLETLISFRRGILSNKESLDTLLGQLKEIKITEINANALKSKIDQIKQLQTLSKKLKEYVDQKNIVSNEYYAVSRILPMDEQEYKNILKEAKICPICKQDTSKCEVHI